MSHVEVENLVPLLAVALCPQLVCIHWSKLSRLGNGSRRISKVWTDTKMRSKKIMYIHPSRRSKYHSERKTHILTKTSVTDLAGFKLEEKWWPIWEVIIMTVFL